MNITGNEKAPAGHNREGLSGNQNFINAGGISKGFDVFNDTENTEKKQCPKCYPPLSAPRGAMQFCTGCQADADRTKTALLDNFRRHRKIVKLDCFCFACDTHKTLPMMHKIFPICRKCFGELRTKGATARSNFIDRATNNFFKGLKKAVII